MKPKEVLLCLTFGYMAMSAICMTFIFVAAWLDPSHIVRINTNYYGEAFVEMLIALIFTPISLWWYWKFVTYQIENKKVAE